MRSGWPADPERKDICGFSLCRHKQYPNPQGILQKLRCRALRVDVKNECSQPKGQISSLIPHCKQTFSSLQCPWPGGGPLSFSQPHLCPSATHDHLHHVRCAHLHQRRWNIDAQKKICDVIQGCSGYKTIRWVFKEKLCKDGEASSGLQGKGLTDKREEAGGHRKMSGLFAEELGRKNRRGGQDPALRDTKCQPHSADSGVLSKISMIRQKAEFE